VPDAVPEEVGTGAAAVERGATAPPHD
jgi:hypothetical protein